MSSISLCVVNPALSFSFAMALRYSFERGACADLLEKAVGKLT